MSRLIKLGLIWGVLFLLAGVIVAIEQRDRAAITREENQEPGRDARLLLPVPLEQIGAVEVVYAGGVHRFERDAAGAWLLHGVHVSAEATHAHQADPAMAQRIETALQLLGRTRQERTMPLRLDVPISQTLQQYGLANPTMVILLYAPKDIAPLLQVAVGDVAPDKLSRYTRVMGEAAVVTIPDYQITSLLTLISATTHPVL